MCIKGFQSRVRSQKLIDLQNTLTAKFSFNSQQDHISLLPFLSLLSVRLAHDHGTPQMLEHSPTHPPQKSKPKASLRRSSNTVLIRSYQCMLRPCFLHKSLTRQDVLGAKRDCSSGNGSGHSHNLQADIGGSSFDTDPAMQETA